MMPVRGTGDHGFKYDPFTGLLWPQRAESADLYIQAGVPMKHTLDWLDLYVVGAVEEEAEEVEAEEAEAEAEEAEEVEEVAADTIIVPGDAWADWDAETQTFLTVEEYYNKLITELPANAEADVAAAEAGAGCCRC